MKAHAVVVEKRFNAPLERVWQAITDKEQMREWYFELDDFKAEVGFEFRFAGQGHKGTRYQHRCKITEVIPCKKLQYSWQYEGYEGYSVVSFELFAEGQKTLLRLTHHGLESFPQNNPDFAKESFGGGWKELITNSLEQYLQKHQPSLK